MFICVLVVYLLSLEVLRVCEYVRESVIEEKVTFLPLVLLPVCCDVGDDVL